MSGLWTPSGGDPRAPGGEPAGSAEPEPTEDELDALREIHARLLATPVADVIANHALGLWQLALVHLGAITPPDEQGGRRPPDLASAGLAIDALALLVDGLGPRLGEHEDIMRDALVQAQALFVELADVQGGEPGSGSAP